MTHPAPDPGAPSDDDFAAFGTQAEQLERRIAAAEARGEPVPAEARAMLDALRSIARAVDDLRTSLAGSADALPDASADPSPEP